MIAIPNVDKPKGCWDCFNWDCEHWGEHGYESSADCPLIEIVTCGECKYYGESEFIKGDMACKYHIGHTYYTEADRFCFYGERRTDDSNT